MKLNLRENWPIVAVGVTTLLIGLFAGAYIEEANTAGDFAVSVAYCEDRGEMLHIWMDGSDVFVECEGELPEVDLHIRFVE